MKSDYIKDITYIKESIELLRERVEQVAKNAHFAKNQAHTHSAMSQLNQQRMDEISRKTEDLLIQVSRLIDKYEPIGNKIEKIEFNQNKQAWYIGYISGIFLVIGACVGYLISMKDILKKIFSN